MTRNHGHPLAIVSLTISATVIAGFPSVAQPLAAHRAVYDVALKDASDRSGITGMNGRIVYEFQGSACDGYTTNFRFVTRVQSASGNRVTDQQTSTYEDGAGGTFRFLTKSFVDERLDRELSGSAVNDGEATVVTIKKPEKAEMTLSPALFPTAHILDILKRADSGQKIYETKIFDGSDDADRVMTTAVILGPEKTGGGGDAINAGPLKDAPYRSISISYYDEEKEGSGESLPDYQTTFKLYRNGVTRDLVMDYGDFSLIGSLSRIDLLPSESCK